MGFFDNVTPQSMTGVGNNHYQFVSLHNIISAFMVTHVGEDKLINKVNRILKLSGVIIEDPGLQQTAMIDIQGTHQSQND